MVAVLISIVSNAADNRFLAGSISGEWNAPLTFSSLAILAPRSWAFPMASCTALMSPDITT